MSVLERKKNGKRSEQKICVLGDEGVGKTSLIRRYIENKFEEDFTEEKLISVKNELYVSVLEEGSPRSDVIDLKIWDWIEKMAVKQNYINAKGALLVCDMTDPGTLRSLDYWKDELFNVTGEVPIMIVVNKIDVTDQMNISRSDLQKVIKRFDVSSIGTSAKSGRNVNEAFNSLAKELI
jgi:small GTP-binding protein